MSAHHYFRDFSYCDSEMLTCLSVAARLSAEGASLAELVAARIAAFPCSGEINFTVSDCGRAQAAVPDFYSAQATTVDTLDGLSLEFDDWRFNLRVSNTEPLLRLNVETRGNPALLANKVAELKRLIRLSEG